MDFLDSIRLLWRRRLVVLLGIVATGLGWVLVMLNVQTNYSATAQYVLLLPSTANGRATPQNPIINQPTGLVLGAGLIAAEVNSKDTVRNLAARGFKDPYSIALQPSSGPLLTIEVSGTDPHGVVAERDELLHRLDQQLRIMQNKEIAGVPRNQVIYSLKTAVNREAEAVPGAKIKALLAVGAAGALATLLAAVVVDNIVMRRRLPGDGGSPPARKGSPPHRGASSPGPVRRRSPDTEAQTDERPKARPDQRSESIPPEGPRPRPEHPDARRGTAARNGAASQSRDSDYSARRTARPR